MQDSFYSESAQLTGSDKAARLVKLFARESFTQSAGQDIKWQPLSFYEKLGYDTERIKANAKPCEISEDRLLGTCYRIAIHVEQNAHNKTVGKDDQLAMTGQHQGITAGQGSSASSSMLAIADGHASTSSSGSSSSSSSERRSKKDKKNKKDKKSKKSKKDKKNKKDKKDKKNEKDKRVNDDAEDPNRSTVAQTIQRLCRSPLALLRIRRSAQMQIVQRLCYLPLAGLRPRRSDQVQTVQRRCHSTPAQLLSNIAAQLWHHHSATLSLNSCIAIWQPCRS